ncbi:Hypothetical predicted protein [Podarcis lilfordi]|uniref:Uncharacterized protein n=1 Tax=Podarcis lilfordi TaxID=74358 RepID=A0AA35KTN3_9SAUR|nr:Hypothetical predicted protein [Podarcis lilfordi]
MNDEVWRDEQKVNKMRELLKEFFEINERHGTDRKIIWDTSKAYMRGIGIQQMARIRKDKAKDTMEINKQIREKEKELLKNPKQESIIQNIKNVQSQLHK